MKKHFILSVLLAFIAVTAFSQERIKPEFKIDIPDSLPKYDIQKNYSPKGLYGDKDTYRLPLDTAQYRKFRRLPDWRQLPPLQQLPGQNDSTAAIKKSAPDNMPVYVPKGNFAMRVKKIDSNVKQHILNKKIQ